jgi:hypothetical protein
MTWNYVDPSSSTRDAVRLLVGDTQAADPLLTDEEIAYFVGRDGSVIRAAASSAEAIVSSLARKMTRTVGSISKQEQMKFDHYKDVADRLRGQVDTLLPDVQPLQQSPNLDPIPISVRRAAAVPSQRPGYQPAGPQLRRPADNGRMDDHPVQFRPGAGKLAGYPAGRDRRRDPIGGSDVRRKRLVLDNTVRVGTRWAPVTSAIR